MPFAGQVEHRRTKSVFDTDWFDPAHSDAVILHCAGLSNPRAEFPDLSALYAQEIAPHIRMYEGLLSAGWRGRMVFMSSGGAVYGEPQQLPIHEDHPQNPKSAYGFYKSILERGFAYLAHHMGGEIVNFRVANPYGSAVAKKGQGVIPILIEACRKQSEFTIIGNGNSMRDYLHIDDLNAAVHKVVDMTLHDCEATFNIGSGKGVSLNSLIDLISKKLDCRPKLIYREVESDVISNVLDIDAAKKSLDWAPQVSLAEGLTKTIEVLNADRP